MALVITGTRSPAILAKTIRLSAHVLSRDGTQLAAQLLGRLLSAKDAGIAVAIHNSSSSLGAEERVTS